MSILYDLDLYGFIESKEDFLGRKILLMWSFETGDWCSLFLCQTKLFYEMHYQGLFKIFKYLEGGIPAPRDI